MPRAVGPRGRVATDRVVERLDPLEDRRGELVLGGPALPVEQLALHRGPEDSIIELSTELAIRPTDPSKPASRNRRPKIHEVCSPDWVGLVRGGAPAALRGVRWVVEGRRPWSCWPGLVGAWLRSPGEVCGEDPAGRVAGRARDGGWGCRPARRGSWSAGVVRGPCCDRLPAMQAGSPTSWRNRCPVPSKPP